METKTIRITPAMASNWLAMNTGNRPSRRSVVDGLVAAFKRGEYQLTHQGIAFADTGELLDGQHRLMAIAQMPGDFGIEMQVSRGLKKTAFNVIDKGLKRTHSDSLRISTSHAAAARFIAAIHMTAKESITTDFLVPFVRATAEPYARLSNICGKNSKVWSGAAVRAAAILRVLDGGDFDYISVSYHALNHDDFDSMSPVIKTLYRQQVRGLVGGQNDRFCRAWRAFDADSQGLEKIQISDSAGIIAHARKVILSEILGIKKAPTSAGPRRVVNSTNSTRAVAAR